MGCGSSVPVVGPNEAMVDRPQSAPAASPQQGPTGQQQLAPIASDESIQSPKRQQTPRRDVARGTPREMPASPSFRRTGSAVNLFAAGGAAVHHPHQRALPELPSAITLAAAFNDVAYFKSIFTVIEAKAAREKAREAAAAAAAATAGAELMVTAAKTSTTNAGIDVAPTALAIESKPHGVHTTDIKPHAHGAGHAFHATHPRIRELARTEFAEAPPPPLPPLHPPAPAVTAADNEKPAAGNGGAVAGDSVPPPLAPIRIPSVGDSGVIAVARQSSLSSNIGGGAAITVRTIATYVDRRAHGDDVLQVRKRMSARPPML